MRKRKQGRKLSRKSGQRAALLNTMAVSLLDKGKIETTLIRAKELRPYVERLITKAKRGISGETVEVAKIRLVKQDMPDKVIGKIFELAKKMQNRAGGYTRIIRMPFRKSDGAELAFIELVEKVEEKKAEKKEEEADPKKVEKKSEKKVVKKTSEKKETAEADKKDEAKAE